MACDFITSGRALPCKEGFGGLKAVYFVSSADAASETITYNGTSDSIDSVGSNIPAYKYALEGSSSLTQTPTQDANAGTTYVEQALELQLQILSSEDNDNLRLIMLDRPQIVVEDKMGNFMLCGLEHGCNIGGGSVTTGAAPADMNGYTINFVAMERTFANFIEPSSPSSGVMADAGFTVS